MNAFEIYPEDNGLVITLIREANIILASLDKDSDEFKTTKSKFMNCISVARAIERTEPEYSTDIDFIINTIKKVWNDKILSPLTLKDDEFEAWSNSNILHNLRYPNIVKFNGNIYNNNAYKTTIRNTYDHVNKCKIENKNKCFNFNPAIFISKGGVITGEYIQECIIRKEIVDKHCFTIQSVINIPVSEIYLSENNSILVVDHREPKLKAIKEFYDCPVLMDTDVKTWKCNIRNYKKD